MKRIPKLYRFKNEKEKEPYIVKTKFIADDFTVSLNNNIYRKMNPNIPEMVVGKEYESEQKPFAYFKYRGKIWPIYDDDPGQQNCIYIDEKFIGAGSFTGYPFDVEYFCEVIKEKGK